MDKLKYYSFTNLDDHNTAIKDRYIIIKQGWWSSLRKVGDINKCLGMIKFDEPADFNMC